MRQTNLWQITLINLIASCLLTMPVAGQTTPQHLPDAVTYNNLGIKHADAGRQSEAIEAYQQALSLQPDLAEAHNKLGMVYYRMGRYKVAIEAYKRAHLSIRIRV